MESVQPLKKPRANTATTRPRRLNIDSVANLELVDPKEKGKNVHTMIVTADDGTEVHVRLTMKQLRLMRMGLHRFIEKYL